MPGLLEEELLELGASVLEAREALLEDRRAAEAHRAEPVLVLRRHAPREARGALREVVGEVVEAPARDEQRLDRDVSLRVRGIDLHDLAPRRLGRRERAACALGAREPLQDRAEFLGPLPRARELGEVLERVDADVLAPRRLGGALDGSPAARGRLLGRGLQERVGGARSVTVLVADARELGPAHGALGLRHVRPRELTQHRVLAAASGDERGVQLPRDVGPLLGGGDLRRALEQLHGGGGVALGDRPRGGRAERLRPPERAHLLGEALEEDRIAVLARGLVGEDDDRVVVRLLLGGAHERLRALLGVAELAGDRPDEPEQRVPDVRVRLLDLGGHALERLGGAGRAGERRRVRQELHVLVDVRLPADRALERAPPPLSVAEQVHRHLDERERDPRPVRPSSPFAS